MQQKSSQLTMVQIYANYLCLLYFDSNLPVRNLNNFLESVIIYFVSCILNRSYDAVEFLGNTKCDIVLIKHYSNLSLSQLNSSINRITNSYV